MANAPLPGAPNGRCCGCQPLLYKNPKHLFCHRCCRSYDELTGEQMTNWAWKCREDGTFEATYPTHDYATKREKRS